MASVLLCTSPASAATTPLIANYGTFIREVNPTLSAKLGMQYARQVIADASATRIDPRLLLAIVGVESHFKANAVSRHGALGLGQLMPRTAAGLHVDPTSPQENLLGTSRYLSSLLNRFAAIGQRSAIAAYNAGPNAVKRHGGEAPNAATAMYVQRVTALWDAARAKLALPESLHIASSSAAVTAALTQGVLTPHSPLADQAADTHVAEASQVGWWTSGEQFNSL